jgi:protoheme IX farnesyltransferase
MSTDQQQDAGVVGPMHGVGRYESLEPRSSWADTARRYLLVTKPRIIELLLVTTVPSMVVAAGGWPGTRLVMLTLFGGALCAGSANAINNWFDRDVDAAMSRTRRRPTAADTVSPTAALRFGIVLGILGFALLATTVNLTAALLATSAIFFYVFVYTMWLKRTTAQAVVIGGAAGCMPVLTGWAAVPGTSLSDPRPWLLFAMVFWWTPPHFWALAIKYRDDYAAAGLPMLPVTVGPGEATRHILLYAYLLNSIVVLYAVASGGGLVFAVPALALSIGFVVLAHQLRADRTEARAMRLFHYSNSYLALLFVVAALDAVV